MPLQKKKKSYQSFPDQAGGSHSFDKLTQLRLPPLAGRSFLDVGCNEGFFCGFAHQQKASRAVGIDMNAGFLKRAQQRFPQCEFLNQTWDVLPEGPFDVILLASAVHYADDQPALIKRLVDHLSPDGTLVLELGIFSSPENEWKPVKRSIDTRYFPTMAKLKDERQRRRRRRADPRGVHRREPPARCGGADDRAGLRGRRDPVSRPESRGADARSRA